MVLTDDVLIDKQELMKWVSRRNPDFPPADLAYLLDLPESGPDTWQESGACDWD